MALGIIDSQDLTNLADAIRDRTGIVDKMTPAEMSVQILSTPTYFTELVDGSLATISTKMLEGIDTIRSNAFIGLDTLTSVAMPDTITNIGAYAFRGCNNLHSIVLSDSLESIGDYAFYGCGIKNLNIPASLSSIGTQGFCCPELDHISVSANNITYRSENNCLIKDNQIVRGSNISVIPTEGVTTIGANAFSNCATLKNIVIPTNITLLGGSAFSNCPVLEYIDLSQYTTVLEAYSLFSSNDTSPAQIWIPRDLYDTWSTTVPWSYSYMIDRIRTVLDIPVGKTSIADKAYSQDSLIVKVILPSGMKTLGTYAFSGCAALKYIEIPNTVTSIGSGCFVGCAFEEIEIPDSVTFCGTYDTFYNCINLKRVKIGKGITSLATNMFYSWLDNPVMEVIDFTSATAVPTCQTSTFNGLNDTYEIWVPSSLYNSFISATNWSAVADHIVAK